MSTAIDDESPFEKGMEARRGGISLSRNPYREGEEEYYVWIDGWEEADSIEDNELDDLTDEEEEDYFDD